MTYKAVEIISSQALKNEQNDIDAINHIFAEASVKIDCSAGPWNYR